MNVLFIKLDCEPLQQIADQLVNFFIERGKREASLIFLINLICCVYLKGLMQWERDHVKLHVTLINSKYRKDKSESDAAVADGGKSKPRQWRKRVPIDGQPIFERFAQHDFGEQSLNEINLCQMKAKNPETGFYAVSAVYSVPRL